LTHGLGESPVATGEILRAQIQVAGVAALAGHASAKAAALVEKLYRLPGGMQYLRGAKACNAGPDNGDWSCAHAYLFTGALSASVARLLRRLVRFCWGSTADFAEEQNADD